VKTFRAVSASARLTDENKEEEEAEEAFVTKILRNVVILRYSEHGNYTHSTHCLENSQANTPTSECKLNNLVIAVGCNWHEVVRPATAAAPHPPVRLPGASFVVRC